jgi:putative sigma-54 modulation protein
MNVTILGKDLKATEAIKDYVDKKVERLVKYFGEDFDVSVTIRTERNEQIAEMTIKAKSEVFRAVTAHNDLYASIDKNVDIVEGQVRKMKTKKERSNRDDTVKNLPVDVQEVEVENEIIKTLYYDLKPITPEDAILKLQEKPSDRFITFINSDTNKVNVLFKLKDNKNFGIVEPDV